MPTLQTLRRHVRARRTALSEGERIAAAARVSRFLTDAEVFRNASTIAAYNAVRGEVDLGPVIELAVKLGKTICLPRVSGECMQFVRVESGQPMHRGAFDIPEPGGDQTVNIADLDLALLPLVAFDQRGTRVGMGGGYYDRAFADATVRPLLIGVGYAWQEQTALPRRSWDVPIRAVITEQGLHWFDS